MIIKIIMYVFQVGSVGICHDILVNFWGLRE